MEIVSIEVCFSILGGGNTIDLIREKERLQTECDVWNCSPRLLGMPYKLSTSQFPPKIERLEIISLCFLPSSSPTEAEWYYPFNIFPLLSCSRASQVVLVVKNPPANAGGLSDLSSVPGLGRSPGGGHGNPLQYSGLGNSMDRGAWRAAVHGASKSLMSKL